MSVAQQKPRPKPMRSLLTFISDIRNCNTPHDEQGRVSKEMAHLRKQFAVNSKMDGYNRRKYVLKLLYIFMLGYEVDFGYMEALALQSSEKFSEKQIGYLALSVLLHEKHEMIPLIISSLLKDLQQPNNYVQSLALTTIANIGGKEMAEYLSNEVIKLLMNDNSRIIIKKKAALCLLTMFRKYPMIVTSDILIEKIRSLLDQFHLGLLTSAMSLLLGLTQAEPDKYDNFIEQIVGILGKILFSRENPRDYIYYNIANPWLQVKLLRFLRHFPAPENPRLRDRMMDILTRIISTSDSTGIQGVNYKNAMNCVLFEAIKLAIHLDCNDTLLKQIAMVLGRLISVKETNVRYLALEALAFLARVSFVCHPLIVKHRATVFMALKEEPDISIRRRSLDLLYGMCGSHNYKDIVADLLNYLSIADFAIREELVVKIALLGEKFAIEDYQWYINTILQLVSLGGDVVKDDIWHRVVVIVTNNVGLQEYASRTVFEALMHPSCNEITVKVGAYILGEFGHLIANKPGFKPKDQFRLLHAKFTTSNSATRSLLLTAYAKFANLYRAELEATISDILRSQESVIHLEIQQRALEYDNLNTRPDLMAAVFEEMPPWSDENETSGDLRVDDDAPVPEALPVGNLLDLENVTTTPQPTSKPSWMDELASIGGAGPTPTGPPLHLAGLNESNSGASATPTAPPAAPTLIITPSFHLLSVTSEGLLFEDASLRIGMKSQYQKSRGRMMFFFTNASNAPLTNVTVNLLPFPAIAIQTPTIIAPTIEPGQLAQHLLHMISVAEFQDFPVLQVSYVSKGVPHVLLLGLPVLLTKFQEAVPGMEGPDFFQNWKTLGGQAGLEFQAILKSPEPIQMEHVKSLFQKGLNFGLLTVDNNPNNLVAAGRFCTKDKETLCFVRLESNLNANMYRLTVRTSSPVLTAGLGQILGTQLQLPSAMNTIPTIAT